MVSGKGFTLLHHLIKEENMKRWFVVFLALSLFFPLSVAAQGGPTYGPFSALKMDRAVAEDVLVQDNNIYVKVAKEYWDRTFIVKISNEDMANYRHWDTGATEMPVKVYLSQQKNLQGYTYRINTGARFIEYWLDGRLILQLERMK